MATLIRIGHCLLKPNNCTRSLRFLNLNRINSFKKSTQILTRYITTSNLDLFPVLVRNLCSGVGIGVRGEQVKSVTTGTTLEFLNSLDENHVSAYTTEQTTSALNNILATHYRQMYEEIPWLQDNIHIAYIQLLLRNILAEKSAEVNQHKTFLTLWNSLAEKCDELPPYQVADCLLLGLYLGVELDSNVVHNLLLKLRKVVSKSDPKTLMTTSFIVKALPGFDYLLMQQVMNRFCEIINARESKTLSESEHFAMLHTASNIVKFLPAEIKTKFLHWMADSFKESQTIGDVKQFGAFMRLCKYLKYDKHLINSFRDVIRNSCRQVMNEASPGIIAEICSSLKQCQLCDREIAEIAERRSLKLLNSTGNLKLCDVSNLFYALGRSTAPSVAIQFQGSLHSNLARAEDIDSITLSNIADILVDVKDINADVIALVQHWISIRANEIILYVTRFNKIIKVLLQRRFINLEDESRFVATLLNKSDVFGLRRRSIPLVTQFLLSSTTFQHSGGLPNEIVRRLMDVLPDLREVELTSLVICANNVKGPRDAVLKQQLSQIVGSSQVHLINKLDHVGNLNHLLSLMNGLIVHNNQRDPMLCDRLFQALPQYFDDINVYNLPKAIQVFQSGIYHLPELYDLLAEFLVHKKSVIEDIWQLRIFDIFATTGHMPNNLPDLMDVAVGLHGRLYSKNMLEHSLRLLVYLSKIHIYPDDILSKLFTLEEIQDIEKLSKEKLNLAEEIERNMMTLNRAVVLECPHLDVPWFHEDYCLTSIANDALNKKKVDKLKSFRDEVEQAAGEILGGSQYMRCSVHSPYYHKIDIECALMSNQKPAKSTDFMKTNAEKYKSKFQSECVERDSNIKIAICVLPEDHYCYNSKHLIGRELVRKRHLEILEYKYVEVPYFDWYSMGLSQWETKVEYLRAKIMNS